MDNTQKMQALVAQLNEASDKYYNGQDEIMSNYEWDALFDELVKLEQETGIVLPDSPTQKTGYEETAGNKEMHEFPALSLAKTKSVAELENWAGEYDIWLSWKLDGLTLVLTYDDGKLTRILTRGNGTVGTNITFLKDAIGGFPKNIPEKGHLVVRGEAAISYTDFRKMNDLIEDEDEKYANPRNLAAGTLNLDDPKVVRERHVNFHAFTLVSTERELKSWGARMDWLDSMGFQTVDREACRAETVAETVEKWTHVVEDGKMDIPVDGLVICYDDTEYASTGSVTGHHATRAGFAFKWQDEAVDTRLQYVLWSCAASTISPVAVFEPVSIEGTTVSRASLCNISEMERLGITDDCIVSVIKANKIIPKCIAVKEAKGSFSIPEVCPVCGATTEIHISEKSNTKTLHCTNPDCLAKHTKNFSRFVSKDGFDMEGLSEQTMLRFINAGFIRKFADLYHLKDHAKEIAEMEGFGEKSCDNMLRAIENRRSITPEHFIYALCIPMIGTDAAKKIIANIGFAAFCDRMQKGLSFSDIDGIGEEKSKAIENWYQSANHALEVDALLKEVQIDETKAAMSLTGSLAGLTFVITGDVHTFANRNEFKAYVEGNGGKVAGSVSKNTDYLVNDDVNSTSSKNTKARSLEIPIISEDEFIDKFGK